MQIILSELFKEKLNHYPLFYWENFLTCQEVY